MFRINLGITTALFLAAPVYAATYYISPSGNDSASCPASQLASSPRRNIAAGLSCLTPGDSLILMDGTYSGSLSNLPNGTAGNYITIKAENDGGAIITGSLRMDHTDAYLQFEGLRLHNADKSILGNHIKFFRTEFKGGGSFGNVMNTGVGTNDFNDTADILIEDCWFHGLGGRYNLSVYNASRVIVRRVIIRHDGGWSDEKGDPEAGLTFYNAADTHAQNVLAIDSNLNSYHTWQSAIYSVFNTDSANTSSRNKWLGVMTLNNFSAEGGAGLRFDGNGNQTGHVVQDAVFWDANRGLNLGYNNALSINVSRLTVGRNSGTSTQIETGQSTGSKTVDNVRIFGGTTTGLTITNRVTGRPTYLPVQHASVGAHIVNRTGVSGTLYGEPGYDSLTDDPLWPYPNEVRVKKEMCTDVGVTRGFCGNSSLTNYIMNYLGNGNPYADSEPGADCDINDDSLTNVADVQLCVNQAIGPAVCSSCDINADNSCNVIDVQRVVNSVLGSSCLTQ